MRGRCPSTDLNDRNYCVGVRETHRDHKVTKLATKYKAVVTQVDQLCGYRATHISASTIATPAVRIVSMPKSTSNRGAVVAATVNPATKVTMLATRVHTARVLILDAYLPAAPASICPGCSHSFLRRMSSWPICSAVTHAEKRPTRTRANATTVRMIDTGKDYWPSPPYTAGRSSGKSKIASIVLH